MHSIMKTNKQHRFNNFQNFARDIQGNNTHFELDLFIGCCFTRSKGEPDKRGGDKISNMFFMDAINGAIPSDIIHFVLRTNMD